MKRVALAFALLVTAGAVGAQEAGPYLGLSGGLANSTNACTGTPAGFTCDDQATTWKIFGGYQFNRTIAVEVGFSDRMAGAEVSGRGLSADSETRAFEALAVVSAPVGQNFSAYLKLGVYSARTEVDSNFGASAEESNTGATYGIGVGYEINKNLAARVDWQKYSKVGGATVGETHVDTFNLGLVFRF